MLLRRRHRQFMGEEAPLPVNKVQPAAELPKEEEGSTEEAKKKKKKK